MAKLCWQNQDAVREQLSVTEEDWLFDRGSLTKRLMKLSHGNLTLEILSEAKQFLREDEYQYLDIFPSQPQWVREVILKGNNVPWIYARSILIAPHEYQDNPTSFIHTGKQPLGFILFDKANFERSFIEVTRYAKENLPLKYSYAELWARRSCFKNEQQIAFVQEVFLPDLWKIV